MSNIIIDNRKDIVNPQFDINKEIELEEGDEIWNLEDEEFNEDDDE